MALLPTIITGCWQLSAGHHGPIDESEARLALARHVELGMGTLDCGDIYTGVEACIGRFLSSCPSALRAQVQVNTKFVPDLDSLKRVDSKYVEATLRRSARRLRLRGPLDLVQFHWWDLDAGDFINVACQLAALARPDGPAGEQLVRKVGITNFDTASTAAILDAGVPLATAQVQLSLLDRRALFSGLLALCEQRQVSVLCYGALAGGLLSDRWIGVAEPPEWSVPMDAETRSLTKYFLVAKEFGSWQLLQQLLACLRRVADNKSSTDTTVAQIALAWVLHLPAVASCIVGLPRLAGVEGSAGQGRSEELRRAAAITLTSAELSEIEAILSQSATGGPKGEVYELERERKSAHGEIMRYDLSQVGGLEHATEILGELKQQQEDDDKDHDDNDDAEDHGAYLRKQLKWEAAYCASA